MKTNETSPAEQLYRTAVSNTGYQMRRSNVRRDHKRFDIVKYAVMYGVRFFIDDWKEVFSFFSKDNIEHFYIIACGEDNRENYNKSAVLSIEKYLERKPYLIREPGKKTPIRICRGKRFVYRGMYLTCNSFNDEKQYLNTAKYEWVDKNYRITKRVKISHEDIKLYHAELKEGE